MRDVFRLIIFHFVTRTALYLIIITANRIKLIRQILICSLDGENNVFRVLRLSRKESFFNASLYGVI